MTRLTAILALATIVLGCGDDFVSAGSLWARNDSDGPVIVVEGTPLPHSFVWTIPLGAEMVLRPNAPVGPIQVRDSATCDVMSETTIPQNYWPAPMDYLGIIVGADRSVTFVTGEDLVPAATAVPFPYDLPLPSPCAGLSN